MSAGIYVHVPFCLTRCGYCDFNAYAGLEHLASPYMEALRRESDLYSEAWADEPISTVFLGGGTPTLVSADALSDFLGHLRSTFAIEPDAEVTIEANPDTVDAEKFEALRSAGVNRVSMGVQSFDPVVLASLERVHAPESARRAFGAARSAGFDDLSLDLIYGDPAETDASWRSTLRETIALDPDHISAYALTIEPATPLGRAVASGQAVPPDPDVQADRYRVACAELDAVGYVHYEVSNWAKPGRESRHNMGYWMRTPYLGLGAGAHSFRGDRRWWNVRPPHEYLEMVGRGEAPIGGEERLGAQEARFEEVSLGLRILGGVPARLVSVEAAASLIAAGLLRAGEGDRLCASEDGWLVLNSLVLELEPRLALST